ncbi:MAG: SLBB domain-containing protein [Gammaproteobacteria bacterium]|nr:SLBB domain-containing protein [Gammaproteobacteria bacterium]
MSLKFFLSGALAGFLMASPAWGVSQAELEAFKSLPPQQQQALAEQFGVSTATAAPQRLEQPQLVAPIAIGSEQKKGLQHYGYELFAGSPSTFAPVTDVPVPADYVMGPGDTIKVQEFGKDAESYEVLVDREGLLTLPGIAQLNVIGMHFADMKQVVQDRIESQKIGVSASVTMGNLRSVRIFVLGEARHPGSYTVSALTTMTNALFVSGGVKEIGSLRSIQLKRQGELVAELDLYDLLMKGDTSGDVRLQPGDVLFVPPRGDTVTVTGAVLRPAIYELKGEHTVAQALRLAGGLSPTAWRDRASIERVADDGERSLLDVSLRATPRPTLLHNGDKLTVQSTLATVDDAVTIVGHAERTGRYAATSGLRFKDLIPGPDSLKVGADLDFALLKRIDQVSGQISFEYLHPGLAFLTARGANNKSLKQGDTVYLFANKDNAETALRQDVAAGVSASLENAAAGIRKQTDAAKEEDSSRSRIVSRLVGELIAQANKDQPAPIAKISGAVRFPGRYPLDATGTKVSDLLRAAGGLAESAYLLEAEVTRYVVSAEGDSQAQHAQHIPINLRDAFQGAKGADIALQPRDVLTVRYVPAWDQQYEVKILGEVRFPGTYPVKRGETLNELLERAGGLTDNAFPQGASLVREDLKAKEQAQAEQLRKRLESDLAALSLQSLAGEENKAQAFVAAQGLIEELKKYEAPGRLVIDLPTMLKGDVAPLRLEGGDELVIPPVPTEVTVVGEVQFPTSHLFDGDFNKKDYIARSGGLTERADKGRIFVVKANGSVIGGAEVRRVLFSKSSDKNRLEPGDTIVVPLDADRVRPLTLWTSVTQIIYQLGLAAASFNAIGAL